MKELHPEFTINFIFEPFSSSALVTLFGSKFNPNVEIQEVGGIKIYSAYSKNIPKADYAVGFSLNKTISQNGLVVGKTDVEINFGEHTWGRSKI